MDNPVDSGQTDSPSQRAAEPVATVPVFVERVLSYFSGWPDLRGAEPELWFRGISDVSQRLLPGAYWRKSCDEISLFLSFKNTAPMYLAREPLDEWDWYYVMQHYGLPTRLLDWSESPLVALYFAIESCAGRAPCVWVLDPAALNAFTHGFTEGMIAVPGDDDTAKWLPRFCGRGRPALTFEANGFLADESGRAPVTRNNRKPIAIFARRSSPRIVAQRGVFTVHGGDEVPIDELLANANPRRLAPILIEPSACGGMLKDLRALGINKTTLFPEAQSVSDDLKRLYGVSP